jgi:hypothetical protein
MSDARRWLLQRLDGAPGPLRQRMLEELAASDDADVAAALAGAAARCLEQALKAPAERASALDLLAADALLTHACEAAADAGPEALAAFTQAWSPRRFEALLPSRTP